MSFSEKTFFLISKTKVTYIIYFKVTPIRHSFLPNWVTKANGTTKQRYSRKKKRNIPFNFNANNSREMKFVPINMDYCLLSFDALKFPLGGHLHGES